MNPDLAALHAWWLRHLADDAKREREAAAKKRREAEARKRADAKYRKELAAAKKRREEQQELDIRTQIESIRFQFAYVMPPQMTLDAHRGQTTPMRVLETEGRKEILSLYPAYRK